MHQLTRQIPPAVPPVLTFEQIVDILGYFSDEQRSLAWSPEPPYESLGGSDCRPGGSAGFDVNGETRRSRWVRARVRWNKEQKKLGGAA